MAYSVLRLYFGSLRMDSSDEGPSKFSGSGSEKPSLSCSSGRHHDTDPRNTRAGQRENQTKFTHFGDVVFSKPSLNFLRPLSPYNGRLLSYCPSSLFSSQASETELATTSYTAPFPRPVSHPRRTSQPSLPPRKPIVFHIVRKQPLPSVESFI